ncbi:MAG: DNA repair protein RadA [Candidatus Bipolaricaulota bacterium]
MAYKCSNCGYSSIKWLGRCPKCGEWDSFAQSNSEDSVAAEGDLESSSRGEGPSRLQEISTAEKRRYPTGISEFDRVLGGGLVPGSVVLIGGEPGIGKSTLLLQATSALSKQGPLLYISGEESLGQIKMRAERLNLNSSQLYLYSGQTIQGGIKQVSSIEPECLIIDSIQSLRSADKEMASSSAKQVRLLGEKFSTLAKRNNMATLLIGHITKSGTFAGPKDIEHLVDATLYFEGKQENQIRLLRPIKNRFGATDGLGLFTMTEGGLDEIVNPSLFFARTNENTGPRIGSSLVCTLEGRRPIIAEVQALVTSANYGDGAQRKAAGLDYNRVGLLLAVIEKQLGLNIASSDVFLSVVGGLTLNDTATDLGVVASILSSFHNSELPKSTLFIGEVGLNGEILPVSRLEARLKEGSQLGYQQAVVPTSKNDRKDSIEGLDIVEVDSIQNLVKALGLRRS